MRRIGLVALSALLYASAFPPLACTPLAWVALVPLLVAIAPASPRRAALLGLVWGVLMALGVGWPLAGMLGRYFGTPPWIGWLAWLAVAVFAAGVHYAAFAAWVAWLVRRGRGAPLAIAAGWALTELVRGRYAPQNPWALIAYSQTEWPRIVQIADLAGPYGIGFVVVAANAALAGLVCRRLAGRHPGWSTAGVAALVALTLGYGEWRLDTADGA
ncbi:MAG TPA: hypothetical protein VKA21_14730, partial [Candidatus Binatia bacterium]|nr:hypothetical protein [Candidatus Binatia bacterium]